MGASQERRNKIDRVVRGWLKMWCATKTNVGNMRENLDI